MEAPEPICLTMTQLQHLLESISRVDPYSDLGSATVFRVPGPGPKFEPVQVRIGAKFTWDPKSYSTAPVRGDWILPPIRIVQEI